MTDAVRRAIDAVWRIESAKLIAALARLTGDVGRAEDLAQDALVAALEQWPESGIPDNPAAWLMTAAKRRAIDLRRHETMASEKHDAIARTIDDDNTGPEAALARDLDDPVGDDLLGLIFIACHPVLSTDARVALTLRLLGGLTTPEIARAFLAPEATIAQRIVRAKRTLAEARVPFEVPRGPELAERVGSVLEVIYLIFNEGYSASAGDDYLRPALCEDALRLGRILAARVPDQGEVHGLVALLEIQASRTGARVDANGDAVLIFDQDRNRWDRTLIRRGFVALQSAVEAAGTIGAPLGPYTLQASIAACHAEAPAAGLTDWVKIAALYDALAQVAPSPVVELNRAVAVGFAFGPGAGLELADALRGEKALTSYHLLHAVRGNFLEQLGRADEAREEYLKAAEMTGNAKERKLMLRKANELRSLELPTPRRPA